MNTQEFDTEIHDMFDCDCHSCERKLMLHYESLEPARDNGEEEYYRCTGFVDGKIQFVKVDI